MKKALQTKKTFQLKRYIPIVVGIFLVGCSSNQTVTFSDSSLAIYEAKKVLEDRRQSNQNTTGKYCLSEEVMKNWSAEVIPNGQITSDQLSQIESSCVSVRAGKVMHRVVINEHDVVLFAQ